jgi:hypothetical protein
LLLFTDTTLYYYFSTLAQVLAAIVALIAVIIHFRISSLRDFLIGDGKAILRSVEQRIQGYDLNAKLKNRLRDSVGRNDIGGIKSVLKHLAEKEKDEGIDIEQRQRGLQFIYNSFVVTEEQIDQMTSVSKKAFTWALSTALLSVIAILFIDILKVNYIAQNVAVGISLALILFCSYYLFKGMSLAVKNFTTRFEDIN